ncbi:type II toxin-antitoxin system RelE/ParE family toxin [Rhizobium sp. BR 314]|uniref:type II toxin-antitoxin system RelE/ParE family toxin n=1 Tax=Rhizobium sp. BR 314 TaxID=3040013 RepID=UPI0039BFDAD4
MPKYKLSPRASEQLRGMWRHIAERNEPAADMLIQRLFEKFELAAEHPEMGVARPEISVSARILIEGNYVAIYEPAEYGAEIVVVVHGMRNPAHWLEQSCT